MNPKICKQKNDEQGKYFTAKLGGSDNLLIPICFYPGFIPTPLFAFLRDTGPDTTSLCAAKFIQMQGFSTWLMLSSVVHLNKLNQSSFYKNQKCTEELEERREGKRVDSPLNLIYIYKHRLGKILFLPFFSHLPRKVWHVLPFSSHKFPSNWLFTSLCWPIGRLRKNSPSYSGCQVLHLCQHIFFQLVLWQCNNSKSDLSTEELQDT